MSSSDRLAFISFYSIFYVARGVVGLIIPLYFVSVGISLLNIGFVIGVFGASLIVFEILWGVLFDMVGANWLVFAAVALTTATYLLIPSVKTPEAAAIAEFALGGSVPVITVVARSRVIHNNEQGAWAGGFGVLGSAYAVAQLVGSLVGGIGASLTGFADSFYVAAVISVAGYLVYLRFAAGNGSNDGGTRKSHPRAAEATDDPPRQISPVVEEGRSRPLLDWRGLPLLGVVAVPTFIGYAFFTNIIQLVVTKTPTISGSEFDAGLIVSFFWLSTAIFQPLLSFTAAKNARRWIAIALAASFGVFALMTQFFTVGELAAGAFLEGACFSAISPLSLSLLMVRLPKRYVGRAMGVYGAAEDVGVILGPVVGSAVWVAVGLTPAYLTLGATFLIVLVPFVLAMRRPSTGQR